MSTLSRRKIFYVYAILDTRKPGPFYYGHWKFEYEPLYIGKGKGDRSVQHIWEAETNGRTYNVFKNRKIRKIQKSGLQPKIVVKRQGLTEKQALDLEIKLIRIVGRSNLNLGPLTNLSNGGEGVSGRVETEQSRENRSKARYNYIATSPKYEEDKAKALAGLRTARLEGRIKPRTWTDEQRLATSEASRAAAIRYWTERPKAEIKADKLARSKRLAQLNRDSAGSVAKQRSARAQVTKKVKLESMSPVSLIKHKKAVAKPLMDYVRNRTPKQLAAWKLKCAKSRLNRTPSELAASKERRRLSQLKRWANMTDEARKAHSASVSIATTGKAKGSSNESNRRHVSIR